jgi:O-antigen ligase
MNSVTTTITIIALAGVGVIGAVAAFRLSAKVKALVCVALAVPQVYLLPRGFPDVSLATIWALIIAPSVLLSRPTGTRVRWLLWIVLALLGVRMLALLWSPDPRAGLPFIVLLGQFAITILAIARAVGDVRDVPALLTPLWPCVLAEAALVVVFRLAPGLERAYLHSPLAPVFAGPNTIRGLFGEFPNNVLNAAKSGGTFVNGNVAGLFLGVAGLAALAVVALSGGRWIQFTGWAVLCAVPFTGSKAALAGVVLLPALPEIARRFPGPGKVKAKVAGASAVVGAVCLRGVGGMLIVPAAGLLIAGHAARPTAQVKPSVPGSGSALTAPIADIVPQGYGVSMGTRLLNWHLGLSELVREPLLGFGYGGWARALARASAERHGISPRWSPHNVLLNGWAQTGIVGLILTAAFLVGLCALAARAIRTAARPERVASACALAAIVWLIAQAMGENEDIFGDVHMLPVVAVLIVGLSAMAKGDSRDRPAADRGRASAPTVPAVGDVHCRPGPLLSGAPAPVRDP